MRDMLRKRYQVQKEIARNGCFEGEIDLPGNGRIGELLQQGESSGQDLPITINFEFVRNDYEIPMIVGHLEARLDLECQRCLNPLELPLELDFELMIDASDEIVSNSSLDTVYSEDGYIDLVEIAEEELLLAIPLVAMHEDSACNENWKAAETSSDTSTRENPFAVLQQLKTTD